MILFTNKQVSRELHLLSASFQWCKTYLVLFLVKNCVVRLELGSQSRLRFGDRSVLAWARFKLEQLHRCTCSQPLKVADPEWSLESPPGLPSKTTFHAWQLVQVFDGIKWHSRNKGIAFQQKCRSSKEATTECKKPGLRWELQRISGHKFCWCIYLVSNPSLQTGAEAWSSGWHSWLSLLLGEARLLL